MRRIAPHIFAPSVMAALLALAPTLAAPLAAQAVPGTFERGPDLPQPAAPPELTAPRITVDLPPGNRPVLGAEGEMVEVTGLRVTGNRAIRDAEIAALTAPVIGRQASFAELYGVAAAITKLYTDRGWFLSFAYFPAQSVEDGQYRIEVVEGRIGEVRISGFEGALGARVRGRMQGLAGPGLASLPALERALLLARDLGGVEISAALEPGADPNAPEVFDLVVEGRTKPISALVSFDNRGSKYAGPGRVYAEASYGSLLGLGETVKLRTLGATTLAEQKYLGLDLTLPLGDDGWLLTLSGSHTIARAGYDLKPFEVRNRNTGFDVNLSYPLLRTSAESLWLSAGFHLVNMRTRIQKNELYTDRTRAVSLGATWETDGPFDGRSRVALRGYQYLPVFAASINANGPTSRADTNNGAKRVTLDVMHFQRLFPDVDLVVQGLAQNVTRSLYALDEIAPGGARFGRAYDGGEISGDKGLAGSAELRITVDDLLPDGLRGHVYGFYDSAVIWDKRPIGKTSESLDSTGGGMRIDWGRTANAYVEFAQPLNRPVAAEAPHRFGRVFFGVTLTY